MSLLKDSKTCVQEVSKALSRYDGHSTYVKLETILSVPISHIFENNSSCYAAELISEVEELFSIKRRAAQDCLKHGISLGFLERVNSGGGMFRPETGAKKKINETVRIALSPLGRTLRAAAELNMKEFRLFLITYALLELDFDMYGLLLQCAINNRDRKVRLTEFGEQFKAQMQQRSDWLEKNIIVRPVREQIYNQMRGAELKLNDTSIKHHFNLRRQWARYLLHIDENDSLTDAGYNYASLITDLKGKNSIFWLAPTPECVKKLGGILQTSDKVFSAWDLLLSNNPDSDTEDEIVQRVADFMKQAFKIIKLRVFKQAPLASVIPYICFQGKQLNQKVDIHSILDCIIRQHRDTFYCLLTKVPEDCYYQLRHHSSVSDS